MGYGKDKLMKSINPIEVNIIAAIRLEIGHTDAIWTDDDLLSIYDNEKTIHGTISACMEYLAMNPSKAQQWEQGVKFTHYDYIQMAKYHSQLSTTKVMGFLPRIIMS